MKSLNLSSKNQFQNQTFAHQHAYLRLYDHVLCDNYVLFHDYSYFRTNLVYDNHTWINKKNSNKMLFHVHTFHDSIDLYHYYTLHDYLFHHNSRMVYVELHSINVVQLLIMNVNQNFIVFWHDPDQLLYPIYFFHLEYFYLKENRIISK